MKNHHRFLTLLIVCSVWLVPLHSVSAGTLHGLVVEALDGATITVKVDNRLLKVRLCTVVPPRKDEAFAEIARFHLASLITGKQVSIEYKGLSADGSIAGIVTLNETDIGMQMIRDGAAIYNRAYDSALPEQTRHLYEESEQAARGEARGIWQKVPSASAEQFGESNVPQSQSVSGSANDEARRLNAEAYALIQQGNYRAALPKCREAVRLDPSFAEAHKNLALVLSELRHYEEALLESREAIRLKPDLDKAHNVLGTILVRTGNYEGAVRAYQEAIRLNPHYAKAYYNLGFSLTELGQLTKALAAYHEADRLAPNQPTVLLNAGWVLYHLGKRTEAREYWKRVLPLGDPIAAMLAEGNLESLL